MPGAANHTRGNNWPDLKAYICLYDIRKWDTSNGTTGTGKLWTWIRAWTRLKLFIFQFEFFEVQSEVL